MLAALVRAGTEGVSGQALADRLGCSRAAVHRHVVALRHRGVVVDGVHEGYRLAEGSDPVCAQLVQERLRAPITGPVRWSAETGSTNDDAVAAARAGAPHGLVIGADVQNAGRGRRGRAWVTEPGDALLFSVLLRPEVPAAEAAGLPVVAAVAVATALGPEAGIVWPNDIVMGGRKVCGVLCEMAVDTAGTDWVVVGIGVNVRGAPALDGARWRAGSLAGAARTVARGDLLVDILASLGTAYADWLRLGLAPALQGYAPRDLLRGEAVRVTAGTRELAGVADGLDELGRLWLRTDAGERIAVGAGEVTKT